MRKEGLPNQSGILVLSLVSCSNRYPKKVEIYKLKISGYKHGYFFVASGSVDTLSIVHFLYGLLVVVKFSNLLKVQLQKFASALEKENWNFEISLLYSVVTSQ